VRVWDVSMDKELVVPKDVRDSVTSLAFSPDGKLLATGGWSGQVVKLWDVETWREVSRLQSAWSSGCAVTFLTDGKTLVTHGSERAIKFWDVADLCKQKPKR